MAKLKEVTVSGGYTYQAAQYHPVKGEVAITMVVEKDDNVEDVLAEAGELVADGVVQALAQMELIHVDIYTKRKTPEDVMKERGLTEEAEVGPPGSVMFDDGDGEEDDTTEGW